MKQRRHLLAFCLSLTLLGVLAVGCGRAASARGWAAPVQTSSILLVSSHTGKLDGLNPQTLEREWRFPDDWDISDKTARALHGIYGDPVVSPDGTTIYLGDYNGYVYAFHPADAKPGLADKSQTDAAFLKLDGPVIGGVALDASGGTLYVTSGKTLYAIPTADLVKRIGDSKASVAEHQVFEADNDLWGTPILADGKIFLSSLDGSLYALDAGTGSLDWRFEGDHSLASTPALAGSTLLVGGFDSQLHAIDAGTGNSQWAFDASNWIWGRPLVAGSIAYFGDFNGTLYAVDVSNGSQEWSLALDEGAIRGAPAISQGVLVVATQNGTIVGLDPDSHSQRWETKLDASLNADLVTEGDSVLIAPSRCVTAGDTGQKLYYTSVDPLTGDLRAAQDSDKGKVC